MKNKSEICKNSEAFIHRRQRDWASAGAELESVVMNAASLGMSKGNDLNDFSKQLTTKKGTKVTQMTFW
jgi:hypothetical protein